MYPEILERKKLIAVIGMGYVGLPIALEFARETSVISFDIDQTKIQNLNKYIDPSGEITKEEFTNRTIHFTSNPEDLKKAHFFIIAVPTPIDLHNVPDLRALRAASKTVGQALK